MDERDRIAAAEAVAQRWNELKIPWLVAHGLEGYPERIGRDLDILMPQDLAPWALQEARRVLTGIGWPLTACPPSLWGDRLVALQFDAVTSYLELHTMERLRWMLLELGDWRSPPTHHLGPFPMHVGLTLCKAVLQPLLTGDLNRFGNAYLEDVVLRNELHQAHEYLRPLLGREAAYGLIEAVQQRNVTGLLEMVPALRRACGARMVKDPLKALRMAPEFLGRRIGRVLKAAGARIELYMTDANRDVEDFLKSLVRALQPAFLEVRIVTGKLSRGERLRQQYQVLARQGAVLEVLASSSTTDRLVVSYQGVSKHFDAPNGPWEEATALLVAQWVMENWCACFDCL